MPSRTRTSADHPVDLCVAQHEVVRRREVVLHITTLPRWNCVLRLADHVLLREGRSVYDPGSSGLSI